MQLGPGGDVIPLPTGGDIILFCESRAGPCFNFSKFNFYCSKGHKPAYLFIFYVKFGAVWGIFV